MFMAKKKTGCVFSRFFFEVLRVGRQVIRKINILGKAAIVIKVKTGK